MTTRASRGSGREELWTPFTPILEQLLHGCPGSLGAAFVDAEGETVDYAGGLDPFLIKVAAAHLRILLHEAASSPAFGEGTHELVIRSQRRTFLIQRMPEGYALALLLPRRSFSVSRRALEIAGRALAVEASLPSLGQPVRWHPVQVESDKRDRRRPVRILVGPRWQRLEAVLGTVAGLPKKESGFRVRLHSGAELTLVREPGARWYADEPPLEALERPSQRPDVIFRNLNS